MIKKSVLLMMVVGLMVLTSCGVHIEFQSPTSQPVAPPVEGNERQAAELEPGKQAATQGDCGPRGAVGTIGIPFQC